MDDRHYRSRELERQIEQMNRRMRERKREMERLIEDVRRHEGPTLGSDQPSRLPEEEESRGGPGPDAQARRSELGPAPFPSPASAMDIDLLEKEGEFVLTADVPGFSPDEMDVSLVDDVLQIEASQEESEVQEDEGRYVKRERRRSMSRSVALGSPIAEEEISARYENGVLTVRLPKAEPAEDESIRQIDIE